MSDLVAWVKEQVRKSGHLKELIKTHTGLAPPAFIAVVALAAAGTALTVSAVSSLLAPPKQSGKTLDAIIEEEIMPYTPSSHREVDVIPVVMDTSIVEDAKEEEAPANDFEAAPVEEVEAPVQKEIEAPVKEEEEEEAEAEAVTETTMAAADGEDNISSDYEAVN